MKKMVLTVGLLFPLLAISQLTEGISFQGIARDGSGNCLSNQQIQLTIRIIDDLGTQNSPYSENFSPQTDQSGVFFVAIGQGMPIQGSFSDIEWSSDIWIETEINGQSVGVVQMLTVPTAFFAQNGKVRENGIESLYLRDAANDTALEIRAKGNTNPRLQIYAPNGSRNAILRGDGNEGYMCLFDSLDIGKLTLQIGLENQGLGIFFGANRSRNVIIGALGDKDFGGIELLDSANLVRVQLFSDVQKNGAGKVQTYGPNGNWNVTIGENGLNYWNYGMIDIYDHLGESKINLRSWSSIGGGGYISLRGENISENIYLGPNVPEGEWSHGFIQAKDAGAGIGLASMYVGPGNFGTLACFGPNGGIKHFVMPHPDQEDKEIWYASIEGPEAATYERGTTQLKNGKAFVPFTDHFSIVVNASTITVITTPRSAESLGLAVTEVTEEGFYVQELMKGKGNYEFYWEAKGVRKGFENYEVIRDKMMNPASLDK